MRSSASPTLRLWSLMATSGTSSDRVEPRSPTRGDSLRQVGIAAACVCRTSRWALVTSCRLATLGHESEDEEERPLGGQEGVAFGQQGVDLLLREHAQLNEWNEPSGIDLWKEWLQPVRLRVLGDDLEVQLHKAGL